MKRAVTSFFLSSDSSLDVSDVLLATRPTPSVGPGLSDAGLVALPIPVSTTPGTYYIIAKADGDNAIAEALENNNTRARRVSVAAAP